MVIKIMIYFTNTHAKIEIVKQVILSTILYAICIYGLYYEGIHLISGKYSLIGICIVAMMELFVLLLLPTYLLICCIKTYKNEKTVRFTVDEQNGTILFEKGEVNKKFQWTDITKCYSYYSKLSFNVYELYLKSGEIIRFSEMIPLYMYMLKNKKKLQLPPVQIIGSLSKVYIKRSIEFAEDGN